MKIEIYENEEKLDFSNISITDFNTYVEMAGYTFSNKEIDFSSIGDLKGDKETMELAFQYTKKEQLNS